MIEVTVNLAHATPDEIEAFYALSGVGRALDALSHVERESGVRLVLHTPAREPDTPVARLDPVH